MSDRRVALVTGASRGIGAAIAEQLAKAGCHVGINYAGNEEAAEHVRARIEGAGGTAEVLQADVSDAKASEALVDGLMDRHGRLDVLVNNAGVTKDGLLLSMRDADWRKVMDVNLDGAFRTTRRALRHMLRARQGRIINVASISAIRGGRGQANYAAAKAALVAFTRAAALEVAERGIQVNAVLPGFIETDMTQVIRRRAAEEVLARIPCGRFGTPNDVAGIVRFLASEDASWITGQAFVVDGGMSVA